VRSHFSSVSDPGGTFLPTWNVETTKTTTFHKSVLIPITIGYLILLHIANEFDLILEDWLFFGVSYFSSVKVQTRVGVYTFVLFIKVKFAVFQNQMKIKYLVLKSSAFLKLAK
jgi:hypothetical protein